ncbi:MAG: hypothetical protein KDK71_07085, partial [Chlamydiia bacterium]|nr:hypothetical protein [Chlamydiia bacterium]
RAKRRDVDKGKNQLLECDGYTKIKADLFPQNKLFGFHKLKELAPASRAHSEKKSLAFLLQAIELAPLQTPRVF